MCLKVMLISPFPEMNASPSPLVPYDDMETPFRCDDSIYLPAKKKLLSTFKQTCQKSGNNLLMVGEP